MIAAHAREESAEFQVLDGRKVADRKSEEPAGGRERSRAVPHPSEDPLRLYMTEVRARSLLSASEEIRNAHEMRESGSALRRLVLSTRLGQERTVEVLARIIAGSATIEETLEYDLNRPKAGEGLVASLREQVGKVKALLAANDRDAAALCAAADGGVERIRSRMSRRSSRVASILLGFELKIQALFAVKDAILAEAERVQTFGASRIDPLDCAPAIAAQCRRYESARSSLALGNLRLVISVAKRFQNRGLPLEDLIGEGNLGLLRAIEKFDPERGCRFSTYATWWIRQAIHRAVDEKGRTVRVPTGACDVLRRARRWRQEVQARTGTTPSIEKTASKFDVSPEQLRLVAKASKPSVSLDSEAYRDGKMRMHDAIAARPAAGEPDPLLFEGASMESAIEQALLALPPRHRTVIRGRYGIGMRKMTLTELAEELHVSREWIRQIEKRAMKRLRSPGAMRALEDVLN